MVNVRGGGTQTNPLHPQPLWFIRHWNRDFRVSFSLDTANEVSVVAASFDKTVN